MVRFVSDEAQEAGLMCGFVSLEREKRALTHTSQSLAFTSAAITLMRLLPVSLEKGFLLKV
jgi:hypothetical protein